MYFTEKPKHEKEDRKLIDLSFRDPQTLHNPDYRSPNKFYKTLYTH